MAELDNWIKVLEQAPETAWPAFYKSVVGQAVSSTETLVWCIETYGFWPTFEAIMAAGKKKFTSDPLAYVLSVAQSKWKDSYVQLSDDGRYQRGIERSKRVTNEKNEELEAKLRKAQEK